MRKEGREAGKTGERSHHWREKVRGGVEEQAEGGGY